MPSDGAGTDTAATEARGSSSGNNSSGGGGGDNRTAGQKARGAMMQGDRTGWDAYSANNLGMSFEYNGPASMQGNNLVGANGTILGKPSRGAFGLPGMMTAQAGWSGLQGINSPSNPYHKGYLNGKKGMLEKAYAERINGFTNAVRSKALSMPAKYGLEQGLIAGMPVTTREELAEALAMNAVTEDMGVQYNDAPKEAAALAEQYGIDTTFGFGGLFGMEKTTPAQSAVALGRTLNFDLASDEPMYDRDTPGIDAKTALERTGMGLFGMVAPAAGEAVGTLAYEHGASPAVAGGIAGGVAALGGGVPGIDAMASTLGIAADMRNAGIHAPQNYNGPEAPQMQEAGNPWLQQINDYWSQG